MKLNIYSRSCGDSSRNTIVSGSVLSYNSVCAQLKYYCCHGWPTKGAVSQLSSYWVHWQNEDVQPSDSGYRRRLFASSTTFIKESKDTGLEWSHQCGGRAWISRLQIVYNYAECAKGSSQFSAQEFPQFVTNCERFYYILYILWSHSVYFLLFCVSPGHCC